MAGIPLDATLDKLFVPASVAVVGASQREESIGQRVIRNLGRFGFGGPVYPVHPTNDEVAGLRCHASLSAIPDGDAKSRGLAIGQAQAAQMLLYCPGLTSFFGRLLWRQRPLASATRSHDDRDSGN